MKARNGFCHAVFHQYIGAAHGFIDGLINQLLFGGRGLAQHKTDNFAFITRMADADTQTMKVRVVTQFALDIFQAVVTAIAAAELHFCHAGREIQLIMRHQNFIRGNLVKTGEGTDRFAAQVHKGGRYQQADIIALNIQTRGITVKLTF